MDLYRVIVLRKGWPLWDGVEDVGHFLNGPIRDIADADTLREHKKDRRTFLERFPSISRVTNKVPTPEEQAKGISLHTEYLVRSEWEKDELLTWFNQTLAAKTKAINPTLQQSAYAVKI